MTNIEHSQLTEQLRAFWSRPFHDDVTLLNRELSGKGDGDAGFVSVPPSVLTGDPFAVSKGDCLLVLGINPKWQAGHPPSQAREIKLSSDAWEGQDFDLYQRNRATYFQPGSGLYYGRYFTRLGNALAHAFHDVTPPTRNAAEGAMRYLAGHVAKFDLLPWWSADVSRIRGGNVTPRIDPIRAWRSVIDAAVADLKPRAIVVNGCGWRAAIEGILGCELERFSFESPTGQAKSAYRAMIGNTPLLAHPQLNSPGAGGHEDYVAMVQAWRR